jgi:predicted lactoylglutathione lyase
MIAHVTINISDFKKGRAFYQAALAPLGYDVVMEFPEWSVAGFGIDGNPDFWLHTGEFKQPIHVAFKAKNREEVEGFYKAAISAGGKDNGKPEYQTDYSPGYFGAFVFDPDGNNIEAVWMDSSKK